MTEASEKSAMREMVLGRRDAMEDGARTTLSRVITQKVTALATYRRSHAVLAYASFGSELQTDGFLRCVLDQGKTLILPKVNRAKGSLALYEVEDLSRDLEAGIWGILEPKASRSQAVELDRVEFALVPGVAFDARGGRLGHGAGFYDKLLGSPVRRPYLIAGAFENQMVEKVPVDQHDVLIDLVITEDRSYPPDSGSCRPYRTSDREL